MVGADTVQRPGGDAAVVRVHGTDKGLAITTDCTPRYCFADPVEGGKQAIAEAWRNLTRGRRDAARDHRLHELRQPAAARDHGPVRRLHRGHGRGLRRARLPDRVGQRLPLQRDQGDRRRQRDPADPGDRRRRPARRLAQDRDDRASRAPATSSSLVGERGGHLGQSLWLREVPWPRGRPAAAGRPRRRAHAPAISSARAIAAGAITAVPRRVRRRRRGGARRDGAGRRISARCSSAPPAASASPAASSARIRACMSSTVARPCAARLPGRRRRRRRRGRADRPHDRRPPDLRAAPTATTA